MADRTGQQLYAQAAELARALASPHRIALLEHVAQGERPVERLAALTGLSMANASQHLQHLRRAGLVLARREGKNVLYRLGEGPVVPLLAALRAQVAHTHAEVMALVAGGENGKGAVETVSRDELLSRLRDETVLLLDVRPEEEFAQGHLPGAVNVPLDALEKRLAELPRDREVIAYCRGPYCMLSLDAALLLQREGLAASRLSDGFPDWKAAGLPVERLN
ncbi:ArsR family transcriptional regulator [Nitratireductor aquibiodomus]|uniref:ArsR/SmtB family transcription factor n=1 Tax=Nitratireductor aquibiodomus TaxID=204799 RepID=UPI0019D36902|nr:metalloregulator ArsR/SmtB family transcription factor [Nitratireductor aquibiodomus]MBN7762996.1 ArsR family transcriptional regulator [Nitratireductor aquibiodomus]